ncbi:MAG: hypothetical protein ACXAEN_18115 [Candidatus Thorarchaeota archaeon]|jgi:NADPH-dependent ferric siderophore reductase
MAYTIRGGKYDGEIRLEEEDFATMSDEEIEAYFDWESEAELRWVESGGALEASNDYWAWQMAQREPPDNGDAYWVAREIYGEDKEVRRFSMADGGEYEVTVEKFDDTEIPF